MPGASMSTIRAVMPSCLRPRLMASGSVRTRNRPHLARWAVEIQIFVPLRTYCVAVAHGRRAQVGQVAAGLRLAEALAPVLVGVEDAGQPLLLLLVGAPADDHGPDLPDAVGVVDARASWPCAISSE